MQNQCLGRRCSCPEKKIIFCMSVKFTDDYGQSEGAVDQGGPKREMLTLVMLELQNSRMFANSSNDHGKHLENWGQGKERAI